MDGVWGEYPYYVTNTATRVTFYDHIIKSLKLRVDILEKELQEGEGMYQRLNSKNYLI